MEVSQAMEQILRCEMRINQDFKEGIEGVKKIFLPLKELHS
jgi:hypothetical protein